MPKKTHRLFSYFGGMGKIMLKKIRILPVLFAVSIFGAFGINNAWATTSLDPCPISGWYNCGKNCCAPTSAQCDDYCDGGSATTSSYKVTDASSTDSYTCSTTTYTGGSTNCPSSTQSGGTASNCSASNYFCYQYKSKTASTYTKRKQTYCTSCPSGYELQKTTVTRSGTGCKIQYNSCVKAATTPCDGLACEGMTTWRNDTTTLGNQLHRQIRCDTSTNKCEYRCRGGYYNASYAQDAIDLTDGGQTSGIIACKACPTHDGIMSCSNAGGGAICCNSGYYRNVTETTCTIPTSTGGVPLRPKCYTANCIKCPTLGLNEVEAESLLLCYPTLSEGSEIENCYIPKDTDITDSTGTYIFEGDITDDCYWDPDVQTGIIGPGGGGTIVTP